jgi:hypothetical protein
MIRRIVVVGAVCVVLAAWSTALQAAAPRELEPLAFLIGNWGGADSGQSGQAAGSAEFSRGLQDRVILRTSFAEYPAADGRPASRHDDLMVIYAGAAGAVRADYWDSEGHIIRYAVQTTATGKAVFVSDGVSGEPRYRLTYEIDPPGTLKGEFAIAPPGTPEAFKPYLSWTSRKTPSK